jgi:putative transposase
MKNFTPNEQIFELIQQNGIESMAQVMTLLFNEVMKVERAQHLNADLFERNEARMGYANGYKNKTIQTRAGDLNLSVPQTRDSDFYPNCLEKGLRSERALNLALAQMYVQGVSTRNVSKVVEQMCGTQVSSTQVSRVAQLLDEPIEAWRQSALGKIKYLYLDARYESVRQAGQVVDSAVLIALGIDEQGQRQVLGFSVSLSEAEVHWRTLLQSLVSRGLHGLELIISDAHTGLKAAKQAVFPSVPWQRCQFHFQQNAGHYVKKQDNKAKVAQDIRQIFNAPNREEADRLTQKLIEHYQKEEPALSQWVEENIHESLSVFGINVSEYNRKRLRTTNMLERLNQQLKKRTKVAKIFPSVESCERLIGALLIEQSEEWLGSNKPYISKGMTL